ncbi:MAG: Glyoxalase/bleomycin resistance protein/dioxygenase [Patescibacteria group bacterium]|nr:Glyoxalase/bleomycin resistance protein/dioxygenase [Patescibacteria group bacterium]
MNPVVHFEMPYEDRDRASTFYEKTFGWKMNKLGADMGDYVVAHTGETDEKNMLKVPNMINGGFWNKTMSPATAVPSVVIAVTDMDKAVADVKANGGTMLGEPQEIPGVGLHAGFTDTEGNRVSLLKPNQM